MSDNIERRMEFIIEQQAKFKVDIAELKEVQRQQAGSIDRLTGNMAELTENVSLVIAEMREGFSNLIVANEVTRKLTEDVSASCRRDE